MIPTPTIPAKMIGKETLSLSLDLLSCNRRYPKNKFAAPHNTLIVGDEFPNPGGLANGDGN